MRGLALCNTGPCHAVSGHACASFSHITHMGLLLKLVLLCRPGGAFTKYGPRPLLKQTAFPEQTAFAAAESHA